MIVGVFLTIHAITEQYDSFSGTGMCPIYGEFALYKLHLQDYEPHTKALSKNILESESTCLLQLSIVYYFENIFLFPLRS